VAAITTSHSSLARISPRRKTSASIAKRGSRERRRCGLAPRSMTALSSIVQALRATPRQVV